jgi:hypothetical protein
MSSRPRPKRRRRQPSLVAQWPFLLLLVVSVAVAVGAWVFAFGDDTSTPEDGSTGDSRSGDTFTLTFGPASRDADIEFDVISMTCGTDNLISATERIAASGTFCGADLSITNGSDNRWTMDLSCQFLIGVDGAFFSPHRSGTALVSPDSPALEGGPLECRGALVADLRWAEARRDQGRRDRARGRSGNGPEPASALKRRQERPKVRNALCAAPFEDSSEPMLDEVGVLPPAGAGLAMHE